MNMMLVMATVMAIGGPQTVPQEQQTQAPSTQLDDVVVEGERLQELAREYSEVLQEIPAGTRVARWNAPVCVSVTNMQATYAQFLIDRIAANALEAGADIGGPGCRPNVVIVATRDGQALARKLVREEGLAFRPGVSSTNLSRQALSNFQNSDAPVRWWNVVLPVTTDTGEVATVLRGDSIFHPNGDLRALHVHDGSRIRSNIQYDMAWTVVIIDMTKTGGASLGLLGDYASMVSLAQIDAEGDFSGYGTVMNLFDAPDRVSGLSQWDKDYLSGLYRSSVNRASATQQSNSVVRAMVRERLERIANDEAEPAPSDDQE